LLVIPGGADAGYCRVLNGDGNRRIKTYVQAGGKYLGLCAGGYYGSSKCEFEVGRKGWEVIGDRELRFYPGVCRGLAFPGFVYGSEKGARAVKIKANPTALGTFDGTFNSYYNGGGAFVNPGQLESQGVEVLASFEEELAVDAGSEKAAVVYCKVNDGAAVLTGPHPEYIISVPHFLLPH
jgi:biotin--protein ligase